MELTKKFKAERFPSECSSACWFFYENLQNV